MNKLPLMCLFGMAIFLQKMAAQTFHPNQGKTFWCAFPENQNGNGQQGFRIYAENPTDGVVEVPGQGVSIPFSLSQAGSTEVLLPTVQVNVGSGNIASTGIRITADDSMRVEAFFYQNHSSESAQLLPTELLDFDYLTLMHMGGGAGQLSEIVVLAVTNNTQIEIIPSADALGGHPAGVTISQVLQAGETYQLQSEGDLSGTSVICKNFKYISVFVGNSAAEVGGCNGSEGHYLFEQTQTWQNPGAGRHFFAVPFAGQDSSFLKIMALQDSTSFGIGCSFDSVVLNRGEFLIRSIDSAILISANKPLEVSQFSASQACYPDSLGDAAMMQLVAANYQTFRTAFTTPSLFDSVAGQPFFQNYYINIVAQGKDTSEIWVDSVDVGGQFEPFNNGPDLWAAQVAVPSGEHVVWSEDERFFQATTYGYGQQDAYAHSLGYNFFLRECIGGGVCLPNVTTICVGDTLDFSHCGEADLTGCLWHFGEKDTTSVPEPIYIFNAPGEYEIYFEGTTAGGCEFFSTSVTITVEACCDTTWAPSIFFDGEPCLDSTLIFTVFADSLPDSLIWVINGMDTLPGYLGLYWAFYSAGQATVELVSIFNDYCISADTLALDIEVCHPIVQTENCLHMPNAFSPNNDSVNDRFLPVSQCGVSDYSLKIFNRWGNCVFETSDPKKGWDGSGSPPDVYIYSVQYIENQGDKIVKKGDLTLLR